MKSTRPSPPQPEASAVVLADGGQPAVRIVLPESPSPVEEFAAEEMRRHLCEMTGTTTALRHRHSLSGPAIYLNNRDAAQKAGLTVPALPPEGFHAETSKGSLYLLGGGPRGILYSVYEILDSLGCRWFTPEVARIPRSPRLVLPPLRLTAAPAFEFRDTFNWDVGDPLWWVRNRMNGWYTPVPEYMGGHVTYGGFVHTFDGLVPPHEFFAAHPEYFSLVSGTRRSSGGQLCLTNPDVLRIVTERVLEKMRTNPRTTIFSVSQNDCEGYCECPSCRAVADEEGSQSGPILRFVNAVAEATSRHYPDKLIDTLAYWYSLDAPKHAVPHPNVRVRLCPIRCCQGHAFGTCDHPESRRFLKALDGWKDRTPQMYIWHYCTNFSNYPLPMPDFDEIHANINLYRRYGVYGIFMQGMGEDGGGAESMALRGYVISRLLWNPDQPVWPIIDEFLAAFYGKGARGVRQYLDVFHQPLRRNRTIHPSLYDPPEHPLFTDQRLRKANAALAGAERTTRGEQRNRVRLLRAGLSHARLNRVCGTFRIKSGVYRGDATSADLREFDGLMRLWTSNGVQHLREGEPIEVTAGKIRNRLAPHPVLWLRRGSQAIAVVPDLGGRILEWHALGRQWLAQPDPGNVWSVYPMSEGYAEFSLQGLYSYRGWAEPYTGKATARQIDLALDLRNGMRLERSYALAGDALMIRSRLSADTPLKAAWGGGIHLHLPEPVTITFNAAEGPTSLRDGDIPDGLDKATVFEGARAPKGEWRVETPQAVLVHRFSGTPIGRGILGKVTSRHTLALDIRTGVIDLGPSNAIEVTQHISLSART